jgi:Tfp pilus assembly protein PilZ
MVKENRKYSRVKLASLIDYAGEKKAKGKDISESGICIVADRFFPKGTPLLLSISLSNGTHLKAIAKAVWSRECNQNCYENGLEFVSIYQQDRHKIEAYVSETLKNTSERRTNVRKDADILINYSIKADVLTKNITRKGMCIVTKNELPVGKIILLAVTLKGNDPMNIYCRVMWSKKVRSTTYENGIEFWEIKKEDEQTLLEYSESTN